MLCCTMPEVDCIPSKFGYSNYINKTKLMSNQNYF